MLVDAHCHAYGFDEGELKEFSEIWLVSVAEDLESSVQNVELSRKYSHIFPFAGIHPWNVKDYDEESLHGIAELAWEGNIQGFGEIGLDKRYGKMWERQLKLFERFCELACELNLPVNVHALGAWKEALDVLQKHSIKRALIHWYSGPPELLKEIEALGYYVSINPSVEIQPKHMRILERVSVDMILTESDGPYVYRGLYLKPTMIEKLVETIADVKELTVKEVKRIVERNFERFLGRV